MFSDESAEVSEKGVFVELYKALKGVRLPKGTKLVIQEMLKYSTDICFDYESKSADLNLARGKSLACLDGGGTNRWALIATTGLTELEKKSSDAFVQFHSFFEEVELPCEICECIFDINRASMPGFRFFQSRKVYPLTPEGAELFSAEFDPVLDRYFEATVYKEPIHFHLSLPVGNAFEYPWNEFLAGYVVYFYLGSLVRYHPAYLESLLRTKDAWRVESFTKSASETLLRQMLGYILNEIYVFESR